MHPHTRSAGSAGPRFYHTCGTSLDRTLGVIRITIQYIANSVQGALRIEALQQGLLNYLEATGRDSHRLSFVDCNQVLSQALLSLQTLIQQSGAAVTSDPLPTAVANEAMLMHLFQNLIGNSIKYKSEAAPVIHISASRTEEGCLLYTSDAADE